MKILFFCTILLLSAFETKCQIKELVELLAGVMGLRNCITVPQECPNENITFWLYTRNDQYEPYQLNLGEPEEIIDAPFVSAPLKILIHGYTGSRDYSPNTFIRPALLKHNQYNIISIDYGPIVKEPCYLAAVQNAEVVANCTAQLIKFLVLNKIVKLNDIHIIGFSLGAQVAGNIQKYLGMKLPHITGLDPAYPLFGPLKSISEKLDPTDAELVDVIHTNGKMKGEYSPIGHVDFYVNGGQIQPGCPDEPNESDNSCAHNRAPKYYAESINTKVGFWGMRCITHKLRICFKSNLKLMGFLVSPKARGIYSVSTSSKSPYALGKYYDDI